MNTNERAGYALQMAMKQLNAGEGWAVALSFIEQAITAAVEQEREACAQIADEEGIVFCDDETSIAARIRARSTADTRSIGGEK